MSNTADFHSSIFDGLDGFSRETPSERWRYYQIYASDPAMMVFFCSGDESGVTTPPSLALPVRGKTCDITLRAGDAHRIYRDVPVEDGMVTLYFGTASQPFLRTLLAESRLTLTVCADSRETRYTLTGQAFADSLGKFIQTVLSTNVWRLLTPSAARLAKEWDERGQRAFSPLDS